MTENHQNNHHSDHQTGVESPVHAHHVNNHIAVASGFFEQLSGRNGFVLGLIIGVLAAVAAGSVLLMVTGKTLSKDDSDNLGANIPSNPSGEQQLPQKQEFDISKKNAIEGDFNAPVTLVEFSDFECPYCSRFSETGDQLLKEYPGKIRFVYKYFPLNFHANGKPSAIAAECVREVAGDETFLKYRKDLFKNQQTLGQPLYEKLAKQYGVNVAAFKKCQSSDEAAKKVDADYQEGAQKGVQGTPTTFVNGDPVSGALPYENLKSIIETALAANK